MCIDYKKARKPKGNIKVGVDKCLRVRSFACSIKSHRQGAVMLYLTLPPSLFSLPLSLLPPAHTRIHKQDTHKNENINHIQIRTYRPSLLPPFLRPSLLLSLVLLEWLKNNHRIMPSKTR